MTIEQVKSDLREIQYYYAHEQEFVGATKIIGKSSILDKLEKYNAAICKASTQLYYLYLSLYVHFNTQIVAAMDIDLSVGYIKRLNKDLYIFFQNELVE